jgi:DNA-binding NarL/FixJ family response regulator
VKRASVLLADDHTIVVEGVKKLLEPEFDLVGVAEDGRALIQAALQRKPDVVVLDISMPVLNGIDAARQLRTALPRAKIVFLTMHTDPMFVEDAFRSGAAGYLLKRSAASELITAIHEVLNGRLYLTSLIKGLEPGVLRRFAGRRKIEGELTSRQREVLQLLAEGHTVKETAAILHVSTKTVEFHKTNISQKLGARGISELTKYAIRRGIVEL